MKSFAAWMKWTLVAKKKQRYWSDKWFFLFWLWLFVYCFFIEFFVYWCLSLEGNDICMCAHHRTNSLFYLFCLFPNNRFDFWNSSHSLCSWYKPKSNVTTFFSMNAKHIIFWFNSNLIQNVTISGLVWFLVKIITFTCVHWNKFIFHELN